MLPCFGSSIRQKAGLGAKLDRVQGWHGAATAHVLCLDHVCIDCSGRSHSCGGNGSSCFLMAFLVWS